MNDYIDLDRRFAPYSSDANFISEEWQEYSDAGHSIGWTELLKERLVVVVAEAGCGKTTEFQSRVTVLRNQGHSAFYARLEQVAEFGLVEGLEIGTALAFSDWLATGGDASFFLDSVDEAKLNQPSGFRAAIRRFVAELGAAIPRAQLLVSTRTWTDSVDGEVLRDLFAPRGSANEPRGPSERAGAADAPSLASMTSGDARVYRLLPLSEEQIESFASKRGIVDARTFLAAVSAADALPFAKRPGDLPGLIASFKKDGRIGRYAEVVWMNIAEKLRERNPDIHAANRLSRDRVLDGAEQLAAATLLCRHTSIRVEANEVDERSVDPYDVLSGWRPSEVRELLTRPLFAPRIHGTVGFHHRSVREYLAARWIARLVRCRKSRRAVLGLFFVRPYPGASLLVVPSLRPTVAWLALWDADVRERLLALDPAVLLEYGDAGSLTLETRRNVLRAHVRSLTAADGRRASVGVADVRRFAVAGLGNAIRELLSSDTLHEDARALLLRMIREARIPAFGSICLASATDSRLSEFTRGVAAQAVLAAGTTDERSVLKREVLDADSGGHLEILGIVVGALFPHELDVADMIRAVDLHPKMREHPRRELEWELARCAAHVFDNQSLDVLLKGFAQRLTRIPDQGNSLPISRDRAWILGIGMTAARSALKESAIDALPPSVVQFVALALCAEDWSQEAREAHRLAVDSCLSDRRPLCANVG